MEISGSIRASVNGVDIAIKDATNNTYSKILASPLASTIEQLYNFIISDQASIHLNDRYFRANIDNTRNGTRKSVDVPTAFGSIKVFRYEPSGTFVPPDRAGFAIIIPTEES